MKTIAMFGFVLLVVMIPAASFAKTRTFEECQKLALSRGIPIKKAHPDRYMMLKGYGEKTNPKGFMARCMAGLQD
jgi:hypothetical protein